MVQQTRQWLRELRLPAMDQAYAGQAALPASSALGFDERFALLVQAEHESRGEKKLARLLKAAGLRDKGACLEELDFQAGRNLERAAVASLSDCRWRAGPFDFSSPAGLARPAWQTRSATPRTAKAIRSAASGFHGCWWICKSAGGTVPGGRSSRG